MVMKQDGKIDYKVLRAQTDTSLELVNVENHEIIKLHITEQH